MAAISCCEGGREEKGFDAVAFDIVPAALDTAVRLGAAKGGRRQ
jgi:hypothetical protein